MRSHLFTASFLLALGLLPCIGTLAGTEVGNGGGGWVCRNRDPQRSIRYVELVDLFEAREVWKQTVPRPGDSLEKQLASAMERLRGMSAFLSQEVEPYLDLVRDRWPRVDSGKLQRIDDMLFLVEPSSSFCPGGEVMFGQIANFAHDGRIFVDFDLFAQLRETDQAALLLHEAVYALTRARRNSHDSRLARFLVGLAFSDGNPRTIAPHFSDFLFNGSDTPNVLHSEKIVFACEGERRLDREYIVNMPNVQLGLRGESLPSRPGQDEDVSWPVIDPRDRPPALEGLAFDGCAIYLDDFSIRSSGAYGAGGTALVATLVIRPGIPVLGAGGYFRYEEKSVAPDGADVRKHSRAGEEFVTARRQTGGRYLVSFPWTWNLYEERIGERDLLEFAYYVDLADQDGIKRLWLRGRSRNFTTSDFSPSDRCYSDSVFRGGYTTARYLSRRSGSPLFESRERCLVP